MISIPRLAQSLNSHINFNSKTYIIQENHILEMIGATELELH